MSQGLKKGTLLDHGKYRVEEILRQGGFGITYLVTDLSLNTLRAVKEFFPKEYCDRDGSSTTYMRVGVSSVYETVNRYKEKFLKEARNIAKFDHPNIVRIQNAFEENHTAYYVMDYIEGESLSELVKRRGPIGKDRALRYIEEIGRALAYVHAHRINHLDVKPANIMIRERDDSAILIDFGLSKQYDSEGNQTSTTPMGISHGFAPAEQYNPGGVSEFSPETDVYSLAATLYYILSGQIPPTALEIDDNGLSFPPGFPGELEGPIRQAMSKRKERPKSTVEFINALKNSVGNKGSESAGDGEETIVNKPPIIPKPDPKPVPGPDTSTGNRKGKRERFNLKAYLRENRTRLCWIAFVIIAIVAISFIFFSKNTNSTATDIKDPPSKASLEFEILDKNKKTAVLKSGKGSYGKIAIPSTVKLDGEEYTVTEIGSEAFFDCDLISVTIPNSVTKILYNAFFSCRGLTSVTIPNSVTEIGFGAFFDCRGLTSVTIPNSITTLGYYAFCACNSLKNVTMPSRFLYRKDDIFKDCPNLKDIKTTP